MRHIEVNRWWLQHEVAIGDIVVFKVKGEDNLGAALTKVVGGSDIKSHIDRVG